MGNRRLGNRNIFVVNRKDDGDNFVRLLEAGVERVLRDKEATASERLAAVNAGAKLLMIRFKISGSDEDNFFK